MLTESQQTITFTEAPYSANFRAVDSAGFETQFTIRAMTEQGLAARLSNLKSNLLALDYVPTARAVPLAALTAPTATPTATEKPFGPTCPECGSDCWDNRTDRKPGDKRPLLKCKNQDCDYRLWNGKKGK